MWSIIVMYALLIPFATLFIYFKHKEFKEHKEKSTSIVFKGISTGIILLSALYWTIISPESVRLYAIFIIAGLTLGLAGDIAICRDDIRALLFLAMIFFGLGHIAYSVAELRVSHHALWAIPIFIVLYMILFLCFKISKVSFSDKKLIVPAVLYSAVILSMLSFAITVPFSVLPGGVILLLGAMSFTASDTMVAVNNFITSGRQLNADSLQRAFKRRASFGKENKGMLNDFYNKLDVVCLFFYFLGQSLFALSIFFMGLN